MGNEGSRVSSTAIGVAVGFGILGILFSIAIIQFCCKYKCKKCKKCCKKKKPSLKDKVLRYVERLGFHVTTYIAALTPSLLFFSVCSKVGAQKSPPPFSISGVIK
ncbi:unnamed protein product [Tetraodon nigroviridis]|uniref:(spotted green pufferfish) hypothetical protein n=1 Tax=Tetraodon nigroviridis TaxID=99883 RepID=Q4SPF9_TETNG|nr:unnamed protein product [Tetraodon nigroviridis]